MQSYISHRHGTVFNLLIIFFSFFSLPCFIDLLRKISEIIENMAFSLIFVLRKMWYFRLLRKITKIWYLRWAFLRKCCFSSSDRYDHTEEKPCECFDRNQYLLCKQIKEREKNYGLIIGFALLQKNALNKITWNIWYFLSSKH